MPEPRLMAPNGKEVSSLTDSDKEADQAMEIMQDSALLSLPLEVFQTVARHMDVGTFYASLFTCKYFLKAGECRPNILRHLYHLPGLRLGLDDLSTSDLLRQFRKRAAESGCASSVLANVSKYQQTSFTSLTSAVFAPANPTQPDYPDRQARLATIHDRGIIMVYDLLEDQVRLKKELHIRPEDGDQRSIEIVKMAFASGSHDLAVLYRHRPTRLPAHFTAARSTNPFAPLADIYKLVTFHYLWSNSKGFFYDSHQQETRDIRVEVDNEQIPVGLALSSDGHACIAWKTQSETNPTKLILIGRNEDLMQSCTYGKSDSQISMSRFL